MLNAKINGLFFMLPVSAYDALVAGNGAPMAVEPLTPEEFIEVYPFATEAEAKAVCRRFEYVYGGRQGNVSRYRTELHWDKSTLGEEGMLTHDKRQQAINALTKANPGMTTQQIMQAAATIPTDYSYAYEPGSEAKERAKARHLLAVKWWLFKHNLGPEPAEPLGPFEPPAHFKAPQATTGNRFAPPVAKSAAITTPSKPGAVKTVWEICERIGVANRAAIMEACAAQGINSSTAATQYSRFKRAKAGV